MLALQLHPGIFDGQMRTLPFLFVLYMGCPLLAQEEDIHLFSPYSEPTDSAGATSAGPVHQDSLVAPVAVPGTVRVTESAAIQHLMAGYAAKQRPLTGYRVQIFLGDRSKAEEARRNFLVHHPDIPAYLSYLAPNFKVRVGDLRDRVEAEHLQALLKDDFPGLYVVPDRIELPQLPEANP